MINYHYSLEIKLTIIGSGRQHVSKVRLLDDFISVSQKKSKDKTLYKSRIRRRCQKERAFILLNTLDYIQCMMQCFLYSYSVQQLFLRSNCKNFSNPDIQIWGNSAKLFTSLIPSSKTRTVPFLGNTVTTYCEESLLFKSLITNHTLEVPFINYVLLQCMNFAFQNNASSFASEEKSSTRGMMSRDRFQILKLFFLTDFAATLRRSLRRQLHSIVTSTKEQRRFPLLIFSATNQSLLKALLSRDWASFLEQVESALQIFSEMATPVVRAIRATISGNLTSLNRTEFLFLETKRVI